MSGVNKVIIIGNLGGDPEITETRGGKPVATMSVAVNKSWRDKASGERKEDVQWIRVVVFHEHLVKLTKDYLHKGSRAYIEGEFRTRKWTDKDGIERYMTEVVLSGFQSQIVLLDAKEGGGNRAPTPDEESYYNKKAAKNEQKATDEVAYNDEIPF